MEGLGHIISSVETVGEKKQYYCDYRRYYYFKLGVKRTDFIIITTKMKNNRSAFLTLALLISLFVIGSTRSTLSYSFSNLNYGGGQFDPSRLPAYPLGFIPAGNTVEIEIKTWNKNVIGDIIVGLINSSSFANYTTVAMEIAQAQTTGTYCDISNLCSIKLAVNSTNTYYFYVIPFSITGNFVQPLYIVAYTYPGLNSINKQQILKVADVLRVFYIGKYFYIQSSTGASTENVQFSIAGVSNNTMLLQSTLFIVKTDPINFSIIPQQISFAYKSYVAGVLTVTAPLTKGYYMFIFYVAQTTSYKVTISWQTDPYACPQDPQYADIYALTQGCTYSQRGERGFPCLNFNDVTQECTSCINGYTLDNATKICEANTQCPERQYYHFGTCYDVSPLCGSYDIYTGDCLGCASPFLYDVVAGACVPRNVTCTQRQWRNISVCVDVPAACTAFDPQTGRCSACVDTTSDLVDGVCVAHNTVCAANEYVENSVCVPIPGECLSFDKVRGWCSLCIAGYFTENGVCQRVKCPQGQTPSRFGLFCIDVSPLCGLVDPVFGKCLTCKSANHIMIDGACAQAVNTLAGCKARERLGFGACVHPQENCRFYNLAIGECDRCENGFEKDFRGLCVAFRKCGAGEWAVNGECLAFPESCIKVDSLGLCSKCVNNNYRLQAGQCVFFKSCADRQYLNALQECIDVNETCLAFNPTNGECVTCREPDTNPNMGVCCAAGSLWDGKKCSEVTGTLNATSSACLTVHPSLGICLQCGAGFTPDPVLTAGCVPQ